MTHWLHESGADHCQKPQKNKKRDGSRDADDRSRDLPEWLEEFTDDPEDTDDAEDRESHAPAHISRDSDETRGTGLAHWLLFRGEGQGGQDGALVRHEDREGARADVVFCLAFLRLQVSLEERLARHGIASTTASAHKGISGGHHDEDLTSLFNPTFMDDLAVFVEGDTPESMLDKLSTALQVVKEVCEENSLTLKTCPRAKQRPVCSSEATRPRR